MKTEKEIRKELDKKTKEVETLKQKVENLSQMPQKIRDNHDREQQVNAKNLQEAFSDLRFNDGFVAGLKVSLDEDTRLASEKK